MSSNRSDDLYEVLQVSPNADLETIERVFRLLAKRFHPDNSETGSDSKFKMLMEAHHVLSSPERRAAYDAKYEAIRADKWKTFFQPSSSDGFESDLRLQQGIMSVLYAARRQNVNRPGVGPVMFENLLSCPREIMDFHLWYLKEKGFIQRTDNGEYAITAAGVDEILRKSPTREQGRLSPPDPIKS